MSTAKILVIDDEPSLLDLVTGYLRKEGYEVQTAMDGSSGFKVARATMNKVKQNLFWAFVYNSLGIPVAAGLFYPIVSLIISRKGAVRENKIWNTNKLRDKWRARAR